MEKAYSIWVSAGKNKTVDENGNEKESKRYGYVPKLGRQIADNLRKRGLVKITCIGDASAGNALKALAHAKVILGLYKQEYVIKDIYFEDAKLGDDKKSFKTQATVILVEATSKESE